MEKLTERTEVGHFHMVSDPYRREYERDTPDGYSFRVRRDKVLALLPHGAGKKILDLASGPGVMIRGLREKEYDVTCVDAAPGMIELAKKEASSDPHVTCEVGDAYELRFSNGEFDAVTAMGLIEYLLDEKKFIVEHARVLKQDGISILTFPNVCSPWRLWNRLLVTLASLFRGEKPGLMHREYTRRCACALLTDHGFSVEKVVYYNFKLIPFPLDRLFPRFTALQSKLFEYLDRTPLRCFGTGFIVKATKH